MRASVGLISIAILTAAAAAQPCPETQRLTPPNAVDPQRAGDQFGFTVAIDGDTAVVGSYTDDTPDSNRGSADVFVRQGAVWVHQARLLADDGAADDQFGVSVDIDGDTI